MQPKRLFLRPPPDVTSEYRIDIGDEIKPRISHKVTKTVTTKSN